MRKINHCVVYLCAQYKGRIIESGEQRHTEWEGYCTGKHTIKSSDVNMYIWDKLLFKKHCKEKIITHSASSFTHRKKKNLYNRFHRLPALELFFCIGAWPDIMKIETRIWTLVPVLTETHTQTDRVCDRLRYVWTDFVSLHV